MKLVCIFLFHLFMFFHFLNLFFNLFLFSKKWGVGRDVGLFRGPTPSGPPESKDWLFLSLTCHTPCPGQGMGLSWSEPGLVDFGAAVGGSHLTSLLPMVE